MLCYIPVIIPEVDSGQAYSFTKEKILKETDRETSIERSFSPLIPPDFNIEEDLYKQKHPDRGNTKGRNTIEIYNIPGRELSSDTLSQKYFQEIESKNKTQTAAKKKNPISITHGRYGSHSRYPGENYTRIEGIHQKTTAENLPIIP